MLENRIDRRQFLKSAALGAAALSLTDVAALAAPLASKKRFCDPAKKMNIAGIGCGGKGASDIGEMAKTENIVALCDVDYSKGMDTFKKYPGVPIYKDFRQMLREMGDKIDGVTVSTPDHMHFPAAMMAMEMGKHVYVQKPLTHTVGEARLLTETAAKYGVVTQMGNQGHSNEGTRLLKEWVQGGAIGKVREVHIWTNRPIWPQGIQRPLTVDPIPETLDWNLWLGVAPDRPYNKAYMPFAWRGWWDFGCGALGDMGCHTMDAAFWALDLKYPVSVVAECDAINPESAPKWSIVTYEFPARGSLPPVTLKWYDGGKLPPRPKELEADRQMSKAGQLLIGDKGVILETGDYCDSPRLIPEAAMKDFQRPEKTLPRVKEGHYANWVLGCKGGPAPCSNFEEHSGPLTEMVVIGNLAIRIGKKIAWDGPRARCTNLPEAEPLVNKAYRVF